MSSTTSNGGRNRAPSRISFDTSGGLVGQVRAGASARDLLAQPAVRAARLPLRTGLIGGEYARHVAQNLAPTLAAMGREAGPIQKPPGTLGARIAATPRDACDGAQGSGAIIDSIDFSRAAYSGPAPNNQPNVHQDDLGPGVRRPDGAGRRGSNRPDPAFKGKVRRFLDAVRRNDRAAAAAFVSFPAATNRTVGASVRRSTLRTKADLLAQWDRIFTPAYLRKLQTASPDDMSAKGGMALVGDGLIWFDGNGAKMFNLD